MFHSLFLVVWARSQDLTNTFGFSQIGIAEPNTGGFGLGSYAARSHDGTQGYGTSLAYGTTRIDFASPVSQFGGYWASASTTIPIMFSFYNAQGSLVGTDSVLYSAPNNNGTPEWFGWNSVVGISRIDYSGSWVVNDSLRFTNVPEPSSATLLSLATCIFVTLRFYSARQQT
jgi:hypothetical protein